MEFTFSLKDKTEKLVKNWEVSIGSCHAATALRADYQEQLKKCQKEIGFRYVRFHGLFDDDMSVVLKAPFTEALKLSFSNIDKIFDFLLSINMKPFVEIGFMPEHLASGTKTIFHYKGNTTPPKDYDKWAWLIQEFIRHIIDRYGRGEVRQWFFEIWNEPNLGGTDSPYGFWSADMDEYFKLYQITANTIKYQDTFLRVGGPATSNNAWITELKTFCKNTGTPIDFISTHHYPTDVILGYGVEDSANFNNPMKDMNEMVKKLADEDTRKAFMEDCEVFQSHLWEHVDRGVLTEMTQKAVYEGDGLPVYYTEWGSLAGIPSDGPFGASFISKTVMDGRGLAAGYSFWTFSDIFEESGQESSAFFGGFGLLTQQGIPKAPYRAFQLLHELGEEIYSVRMTKETIDVYAVKNEKEGALQLMIVNHHSLLHAINTQKVTIQLTDCKKVMAAEIKRIDEYHGNALKEWQEMGSPVYLDKWQEYRLFAASRVIREEIAFISDGNTAKVEVTVPPMGIALVTLFFA